VDNVNVLVSCTLLQYQIASVVRRGSRNHGSFSVHRVQFAENDNISETDH